MAKKIVSLLKGAAITGVAIGGASALTGADLVFAQELSAEVNEEAELAVEQTVEETVEETHATEQQDEYEVYSYETVESAQEAITETEVEIAETEELKAEAEIEKDIIVENLVSAQAEQATVSGELADAQSQLADVQQEMADRQQSYEEAGYANEGLDEQEAVVSEKMAEEAAVRAQLYEQNKNLTMDNYYKNEGRQLAKEMILYKLIMTGEVSAEDADKVFFGENFNKNYDDKHYCVKYVKIIDDEPVYVERYFDYVTCDEEGNSMFQGLVENENDSSVVAGINVVEKTPTYKVWTEDPHKVSTYEKNVPGKIKNQTVYGYTFHAAQRDEQAGFYAEEGQQKKGIDWYTQNQYKQDVDNRKEYKDYVEAATTTIANLNDRIAELTATLSNVTNQINNLREDLEDIQVEIQGYDNKIEYLKDKVDALGDRIQEIIASQQAQNNVAPQATTAIEDTPVPATTVEQTQEQAVQPSVIAPVRQVEVQSIEDVQVPLAVMDVEAEEDVAQTVTIPEQEVAKAGETTKSMAIWNGSTLPLLGAIAGFIAFTKVKREEEQN